MFDATKLFKDRLESYVAETSRYLKYIFNGHIAIAMLFLISAIAVYYQQWLATLSPDFPSAWIIAAVFGFVASYTPVKTLLLEADLVFLIPAEHKMKAYFRNALIFSYIHQLFLAVFMMAAISPLYFHAYADRGGQHYLLSILALLFIKALNLVGTWSMLKYREKQTRMIDQANRFGLNVLLFYLITESQFILASLVVLILIGLVVFNSYYRQKGVGVTWDLLVEQDQHQMQTFYRIANLFTDVPHLKKRFKQRRLLVSLLSRVPFNQKQTYDYLYRITFIRSGDYLGMYLRLTVIGGLLIVFVPNVWMKLIFALLFTYMSIFQMLTLYYHYRTTMWLDIYPVSITERQRAIKKWLFQLTFLQTIIFVIIFLVMKLYVFAFLMLVGGTLLTVTFIKVYVQKRIMLSS